MRGAVPAAVPATPLPTLNYYHVHVAFILAGGCCKQRSNVGSDPEEDNPNHTQIPSGTQKGCKINYVSSPQFMGCNVIHCISFCFRRPAGIAPGHLSSAAFALPSIQLCKSLPGQRPTSSSPPPQTNKQKQHPRTGVLSPYCWAEDLGAYHHYGHDTSLSLSLSPSFSWL